ncbi:response regulator transcription factor [Nostoc ellipsosporum NOK]|nr:response regulator transcription factor [Nostoc ellipsosporum NOK]
MTDPESPIVYIVDDDGAVREALEDLLSSVALGSRSFASVQEFVGAARADAPSCLVLDVRMPGHSGMAFLAHMAECGIAMPTVMITGHGDIAMSVRAMKDGAIEFLTKPFRDQDLLDAVNRGIEIDRTRRATAAETRHVRQLWEALSPGEREVARLVVRGLLNKQVAAELGLSEITVKVRRGHMMRKMEARTLPDLVRAFDRIHA